MEKHTPHRGLTVVHALVASGKVRATASAIGGARELGINSLAEMCEVIAGLTRTNFYKSMTTYADHNIWQDVYRAKSQVGSIFS